MKMCVTANKLNVKIINFNYTCNVLRSNGTLINEVHLIVVFEKLRALSMGYDRALEIVNYSRH